MNKLLNPIRAWIFNTISRATIRLFSSFVSSLLLMPKPAPIRSRRPQPGRTIDGEYRRLDDANRW